MQENFALIPAIEIASLARNFPSDLLFPSPLFDGNRGISSMASCHPDSRPPSPFFFDPKSEFGKI